MAVAVTASVVALLLGFIAGSESLFEDSEKNPARDAETPFAMAFIAAALGWVSLKLADVERTQASGILAALALALLFAGVAIFVF